MNTHNRWRVFRAWAAVMIAIGLCGSLARAGTIIWDGDCSNTIWTSTCPGSQTNWNTNQLPTLSDEVALTASDPVVNTGAEANAMTISCESGLTVTGLFKLAGGGTIQNLTVNTVPWGIEMLSASDLVLTGSPNWVQGHFFGPGVLVNQGAMTGHSIALEDSSTFENHATYQYTGAIVLATAASLVNEAGGQITMKSSLLAGGMVGNGEFHNEGTFKAQYSGTSLNGIGPIYYQSGSGQFIVDAQAAPSYSVSLNNGAEFSGGSVSVGENANLCLQAPGLPLDYVFNGLPMISGDGNMHVELSFFPGSPQMKVLNDLDVALSGVDGLRMNTGYIALAATLNNFGRAEWSNATIRALGVGTPLFHNHSLDFNIEGGSGVNLETNFLNSGLVEQRTVTHLMIPATGIFTNDGEYANYKGNISKGAVSGMFVNNGFFKKPNDPLSVNSTVDVDFFLTPKGTVQIESDVLTFNALRLEGGTVEISQAAEALLWGTHIATSPEANPAVFSGQGLCRLQLTGMTFRVEDQAKVIFDLQDAVGAGLRLENGARIGGLGTATNQGDFLWAGGTIGISNGAGGFNAKFINEDYTGIVAGSLIQGAGSSFINAAGANVDQANSSFSIFDAKVINKAMWLVSDGSVSVSGNGQFINDPSAESGGDDSFDQSPNATFRCDVDLSETVIVSCPFDNKGVVSAKQGNLVFTGPIVQLQNGELTGGTWVVHGGASLDLPGFLTKVGPGAVVQAAGDFNDLERIQENQGDLTVSDKQFCGSDGICDDIFGFLNGGFLAIDPPTLQPTLPSITVEGEVENSILGYAETRVAVAVAGGAEALIFLQCPAFNNAGTVAPGGTGAPGPFSMIGDFNQSDTGVLRIDLGGLTPVDEHDQLIVDGDVSLDGTLDVSILTGYAPRGGEQFTIITASNGTITGAFDQITGGGQYSLTYNSGNVVLTLITPPVPGDIDTDGVVNVDDLLAVIAAWGACPNPPANCPADLNNDGLVNVDDLLIVINNWR